MRGNDMVRRLGEGYQWVAALPAVGVIAGSTTPVGVVFQAWCCRRFVYERRLID